MVSVPFRLPDFGQALEATLATRQRRAGKEGVAHLSGDVFGFRASDPGKEQG